MPNKKLFSSSVKDLTVNDAGGAAYKMSDEAALATYAVTGTLHDTYYVSASSQLKEVIGLAHKVDPEFLARTSIYGRTKGFMKDLPAALLAVLMTRDTELFEAAFPFVIDNARMLRTFVQLIRSGQFGRKSFGSVARRCIRKWIDGWNDAGLFFNSCVGNDPSMKDVLRMIHPKPKDESFNTLFAYLVNKPYNVEQLPDLVARYEDFKKALKDGNTDVDVPDVNFQYLTALQLTEEHWKQIAKTASWQTVRMNLNTFQRHNVFNDPELIRIVADKLRDADLIKKSKAFPYQLFVAYLTAADIPFEIKEALQDAMEIAVSNVPLISGNVVVCLDISGSMTQPVTGFRGASSSTIKYMHVAALMTAAVVRRNPKTRVIAFNTEAKEIRLNPRDSIITNASTLGALCEGGTSIEASLRYIVERGIPADNVIIVSDNESWYSVQQHLSGTAAKQKWRTLKRNNKDCKCFCLNISPCITTQLHDDKDITNISGFSDAVFDVIAAVIENRNREHIMEIVQSMFSGK
jgi:60 kDa SS-A/Ro ribonucleoprotein